MFLIILASPALFDLAFLRFFFFYINKYLLLIIYLVLRLSNTILSELITSVVFLLF